MTMPSKPEVSSEPVRIYTYFRSGVELISPSLNISLSRNDGHQQVTYIEYNYDEPS